MATRLLEEEILRYQSFLIQKGRSLESLPWLRALQNALSKADPSRAQIARQALVSLIEAESNVQIAQCISEMMTTIEAVTALLHALEANRTRELLEAETTLHTLGKSGVVASVYSMLVSKKIEEEKPKAILSLVA